MRRLVINSSPCAKHSLSVMFRLFRLSEPLTLGVFLASGTFILLFSCNSLSGNRLNAGLTTFIYIIPWLLLWPLYSLDVVVNKARRVEIILIAAIIILAIINVIFSDNPSRSYESMKPFILTGVLSLWTSMLLFTNQRARNIFAVFCCCCWGIIIPGQLILYLTRWISNENLVNIFTRNPIPTGTLVLLLAVGPMHCLFSPSVRVKIFGWLSLALGLPVLFLAGKRGVWLALGAMLLAWLVYWRNRYKYYVLAFCLAVCLIFISVRVWPEYRILDPKKETHFTILSRMELYPFALHVFKAHPLFGTGLRPYSHEKYLVDYHQRHPELKEFGELVRNLQTFDNMLVTSFVELGSLLTFAYLTLIAFILAKYYQHLKPLAKAPPEDFCRLLPLIGLAVHALTYDPLVFPPLNWLFHVQLGILAGFAGDKLLPGKNKLGHPGP